MQLNVIAILPAAIASWMAGALWYTLLGGPWRRALGSSEIHPPKRMPITPMAIAFIAEIIMALMLVGLIGHFAATMRASLIVAAGVWLGFVMTSIVVNNAFQRRSVLLTVIDGGHWLVVLLVQAAVISVLS